MAGHYTASLTLDGGAGPDTLSGGGGTDTVLGGEGDDSVGGDFGADHVDGGPGDDTADYDNVMPDVERIIGGAGDDVLRGAQLVGDGGDDVLLDQPGHQTFDGGRGEDEVSYEPVLSGNGGVDTADYGNATENISVTSRRRRGWSAR
jgi:Ca2+-binding RTX toxin-like protein